MVVNAIINGVLISCKEEEKGAVEKFSLLKFAGNNKDTLTLMTGRDAYAIR